MAPGSILLTVATFDLNELYHSGNAHNSSPTEDAELAQVVKEALEAGDVLVYAFSMTVTQSVNNLVRWHVAVTLPTAQIGTLVARHASPAFVAGIEAGTYALGGTHTHSLYQTEGAVDTSAVPVLGTTPPSPPSSPPL